MKFRNALLAATVLALPLAANAQPVTGLYVGAGVGPDFQLNQDVKNLQQLRCRRAWRSVHLRQLSNSAPASLVWRGVRLRPRQRVPG